MAPVPGSETIGKRAATTTTSSIQHGAGSINPSDINNKGFFALFALLGVAMVIGAMWFFFWAKNGGFHFREGDWDDYKSTVLRRKGPDGKTLSNATKSTKLGGGKSIYGSQFAWQKKMASSMARSVVSRDEKGRKGILGKRGWAKTHSVYYGDDFTETLASQTVTDEMTELRTEPDLDNDNGDHSKRYRDRDVRAYKKEKPARVGGLNRPADGSHFDYSNTDRSEILTESVVTDNSSQPILPKKPKDNKQKEKDRAERKAREEAAKMERRWKREAEEAAAALARENARVPPPPPAHARKSTSPSKQPSAQKHRRDRTSSRSASPKKRDFSYTDGPESEVLSTAYTQTTSQRTSSYYDEYRPRASENPRYSSDYGRSSRPSGANRSRQSSPRKKQPGRGAGYRRGGTDSDLE